jgi:hypothetical protein
MAGPKRGRARLSVKVFPPELGISSEHAHYMMFSLFDINGSLGSTASDTTFRATGQSVGLPIPASPSVQYDQGWETENRGVVKSAITTIADAVKAAGESGGGIGGAIDAFKADLKSSFKDEATNLQLDDVGKLLGAKMTGTMGSAQGTTGMAMFDESFAVYAGPAYRSFSFTFSLMPLSQGDADRIKEIIDFFKVNSAPTSLAAGVVRIYELPKVFGITFHNKGKENEYLHKIGKCALTSMNVSYGGEKFSVFDQTDAPVQVDLSLSFTELQLQDSASYAAGF